MNALPFAPPAVKPAAPQPARRRLLRAGAALAAGGLAAPWVARAQKPVTLRLHHFLPPQSTGPQHALAPWAQALEQASGGRLRVRLFPAMQLGGKPPELFDQARGGVVDLIWTVLGYTPGRFTRAEVFELPFMCGQPEGASRAFWHYLHAHGQDEFRQVRLLAAHTHGPGVFHGRKPIAGLQDVKGMRVRGGSRIINQMLSQIGAVPVGMPAPQVGEALSKGVIDAATLPWEVAPSLKIEQIARHHTDFSGDRGLYTQTFALVMNLARYEQLPADLRQLIDAHSGADTSARFGRAMHEGDSRGVQAAQRAGNRIITLDAAETARWQTAAASTRQAWLQEAQGKGLDGARLIAEAERLLQAHRLPAQA